MLKERSQSIIVTFAAVDFAASLLAYALAMFARFYLQDPTLQEFRELDLESYLFFGMILAVVQLVTFVGMGLYQPRRGTSVVDEISRIVAGVLINVLLSISILYFLRVDQVSRLTITYYAIADVIVVAWARAATRRALGSLRARGYNSRSVVIIGTGDAARRLTQIIENQPILGLRIVGYVAANGEQPPSPDWRIIGSFDSLDQVIKSSHPDVVLYSLAEQGGERLTAVLNLCDQEGITLKIVPGFSSLIAAKGQVETMEGIPIISIREVPARTGFNRFLKRGFDFLFSLSVILLLSPVFILTAVAVKLTSRGPVFYKQERVGLDNRPFNMLKFRTMRVQQKQESDTIWTTRADPRITPIGRIMRKLSIDEIPQFFNVLSGRMSVVGPRPERPYFVGQFKDQYHHYMRRHAVKAGITGWAQINGLRGDTSIKDRIEADIFYIENWSFWFDLKIILLTPFKGMVNENAY
ncbi:MAG: undecaprenyl-phosphate glucose phosphotransferase [Spirochaetaceae bacterium]|nr:MAG: undecaprenyl-phosphate glucose phosphotransferase [Spirochaetaceae bacterium]